MTSSSTSMVKYIEFFVLGYSFVHMEAKAKLNAEYLEIDPNLLKNTANLLKPYWISNYGRIFFE